MPTLYDGLPLKERQEARRKAREADKESVRRHQAKVVAVENDGKYVTVEYTQENGERVIAGFKRFMWARPPAAVLKKLHEDDANPPVSWIGSRGPK